MDMKKIGEFLKELRKEKAAKAGNIAFSLTFLICAATIIIQLVITGSLPFVAGETITLLVGGVFYIGTMLHYGIWDNGSGFQSTPSKDLLTNAVCSAFFTAALVFCYIRLGAEVSLITPIAILFFVGIAIAGFILLRILAHCSRKRNTESKSAIRSVKSQERQPVNILIADGSMQAAFDVYHQIRPVRSPKIICHSSQNTTLFLPAALPAYSLSSARRMISSVSSAVLPSAMPNVIVT